jgi:hypothetical protein
MPIFTYTFGQIIDELESRFSEEAVGQLLEIFDPSVANNAEEEKAEASAHDAADAVKEEEEEAAELEEEIEEDQNRMNEEIYADEDDNLDEADFMPDEENDLGKLLFLFYGCAASDEFLTFLQSMRAPATRVAMLKCERSTKCKKRRHRHMLRARDTLPKRSQAVLHTQRGQEHARHCKSYAYRASWLQAMPTVQDATRICSAARAVTAANTYGKGLTLLSLHCLTSIRLICLSRTSDA